VPLHRNDLERVDRDAEECRRSRKWQLTTADGEAPDALADKNQGRDTDDATDPVPGVRSANAERVPADRRRATIAAPSPLANR
jgi:hypothetical protein